MLHFILASSFEVTRASQEESIASSVYTLTFIVFPKAACLQRVEEGKMNTFYLSTGRQINEDIL